MGGAGWGRGLVEFWVGGFFGCGWEGLGDGFGGWVGGVRGSFWGCVGGVVKQGSGARAPPRAPHLVLELAADRVGGRHHGVADGQRGEERVQLGVGGLRVAAPAGKRGVCGVSKGQRGRACFKGAWGCEGAPARAAPPATGQAQDAGVWPVSRRECAHLAVGAGLRAVPADCRQHVLVEGYGVRGVHRHARAAGGFGGFICGGGAGQHDASGLVPSCTARATGGAPSAFLPPHCKAWRTLVSLPRPFPPTHGSPRARASDPALPSHSHVGRADGPAVEVPVHAGPHPAHHVLGQRAGLVAQHVLDLGGWSQAARAVLDGLQPSQTSPRGPASRTTQEHTLSGLRQRLANAADSRLPAGLQRFPPPPITRPPVPAPRSAAWCGTQRACRCRRGTCGGPG